MELPAFLLPATLAVFSLAFGIVWRYGSKPAFWWMVAYAAQGVAYLGEIVPTALHQSIDTMAVDGVFVVGFVGFGQALCLFFGWPRRTRLTFVLATLICGVDAWQIFVADSLKGELLAIDWGLAALAVAPLLLNLRRAPTSPVDWGMVAVTVLTVLNCTVISSMFALFGDAGASFDTYMSSGYVAASYVVSSVLNLVVPLVQLAAVALRAIIEHRNASEVDLLTGLPNRRGFEQACSRLEPSARGFVVTCDIDRFKLVNDGFGHAAGDDVIVALADALRSSLPKGATAARFGGDEFVVFVPNADADAAVDYARSVSSRFTSAVARRLSISAPATASFGIAAAHACRTSLHDELKRADQELYAAKRAGGGCVSLEAEHPNPSPAAGAHPARPRLRIVA